MPFGYLMQFCCWISPGNNYLIALIFFTIIIELILCLLFGIKQQKNMQKQAGIAPLAAAIRKKYQGRDDQVTRQKMSQETMDLYQQHGYSPLSGCMPMLIQLPIISSLYLVIVSPLENMFMLASSKIDILIKAILPYCDINSAQNSLLSPTALANLCARGDLPAEIAQKMANSSRQAQTEIINLVRDGKLDFLEGEAGEIVDSLNGMSRFFPDYNAFGLDFSRFPNEALSADSIGQLWPLILVPVLIVATMILSQVLSKKFTYQDPTMEQQQGGCSMKVMMYSMPLFSAYISLSMPAVVGVYWIYRSISSTLQRYIMSLIMPLPKFTEEDYKKAEKELAGTSRKSQKKSYGESRHSGKVAYNADGSVKRSLHYIDDEEDAPAPAPQKAENEEDDHIAEGFDPSDAPVMKDDKGSTHYKKKK